MLVSGGQQSDSVIHMHVSILFQILFPLRLLQSIEQFPVLYIRSLFVIYFILFFKNFYWSIVDLQCCVRFRCTAKWICYTYIHSFLDFFPIYAITEYWIEFALLSSRSLLVICFIYSSVYMSIPIFQFIPLPASYPLVTVSLFSTSVTLSLFCR